MIIQRDVLDDYMALELSNKMESVGMEVVSITSYPGWKVWARGNEEDFERFQEIESEE